MYYYFFSKARHSLSEVCCICSRFINAGQLYVRNVTKIAHYGCAKNRGWKKEKKKIRKIEKVEREPQNMTIRVIKKGSVNG